MIAGFASFLTDTLVWTGVLIAAVLVLRRPVARVFGPGLAYALWLLPLLRFALPPIPLPAAFAPAAPVSAFGASVPAAAGAELITVTVAAPVGPEFAVPWGLLLTSAWLLGAVLFLIARWLEYRAMRVRLLCGAVEVDRREGVRIVETPAVDAPVALGVRDKVIALPPRFLITGSLAERALAIEHELAHHRGRDLIANIAAQPLLALHWFNPLAWAAWNAMRRDQEAACDARAMAGRDARTRAAYARVIASFAAGGRLGTRGFGGTALAAPMACPVLGDKSIVHRLRSLTMSDISPRRRSIGRWTFAVGAALALPLTATVVYAGQDAPEAPLALVAPPAPSAPAAPRIEKHVMIVTDDGDVHSDGDRKMFERRVENDGKTIVIRSDKPIDETQFEAHLAKLERMADLDMIAPEPPVPPVAPAPGMAPAAPGERREVHKIIVHGDGHGEGYGAVAMAVVTDGCRGAPTLADADVSRDSGEGGRKMINRTRVLLCGKAGEAKDAALASVRQARASIAANRAMADDIRAEVLRELDLTIADMKKDAG